MRVHALVRDRVIVIDCGEGNQRVKWLSMVAAQRYDDLAGMTDSGSGRFGKKHVPAGLEDEAGRRIPPTKTVNRLPASIAAAQGIELQPGYEPRVRVLLLEDAPGGNKSGTSAFLTAIAAVPEMCLVTGSGLLTCSPKRHAEFTVHCRDNFSIPISNGGEDISVRFTDKAGAALRADVHDHNDGAPRATRLAGPCSVHRAALSKRRSRPRLTSPAPTLVRASSPRVGTYSVLYELPKRGAYTVDITIDGDHVVGSPFECMAVDAELPPSVRWIRPALCNGALPTAEEVNVEATRALPLSPTDALVLGDRLEAAWVLHTPNLNYARLQLKGQFPPPAPQAPPARVECAQRARTPPRARAHPQPASLRCRRCCALPATAAARPDPTPPRLLPPRSSSLPPVHSFPPKKRK